MKIIPHLGVDDVRLGMTRSEVERVLGTPERTQRAEVPGGRKIVVWRFVDHGLTLSFTSRFGGRLALILIINKHATVDGVRVIGKRIRKLQKRFPKIRNRRPYPNFGYFDDCWRGLCYYVERGKVIWCKLCKPDEDLPPAMEAANKAEQATGEARAFVRVAC